MPEGKLTDQLVSIIIPGYNARNFIQETMQSILSQKGVNLQVIFVDDGSTDDTERALISFNDPRIRYFRQQNAGVSIARNNGLKHIEGEFVVFFDADDKMSNRFLQSRIEYLLKNSQIDFVCGNVEKFNAQGFIPGFFRGTSSKLVKEILLYDQEVVSCPSNFMFRKSFLLRNNLIFNPNLSSTADKFFLLQCALYGTGAYSDSVAPLYYRLSAGSMSNTLTQNLVNDNERFYNELQRHKLIPKDLTRRALSKGYYMLSGAFWKISVKNKAIKYAYKSFIISPHSFTDKFRHFLAFFLPKNRK